MKCSYDNFLSTYTHELLKEVPSFFTTNVYHTERKGNIPLTCIVWTTHDHIVLILNDGQFYRLIIQSMADKNIIIWPKKGCPKNVSQNLARWLLVSYWIPEIYSIPPPSHLPFHGSQIGFWNVTETCMWLPSFKQRKICRRLQDIQKSCLTKKSIHAR